MPSRQLPSPVDALRLLRKTGEMLSSDYQCTDLAGIFYAGSKGNRLPASIDTSGDLLK